MSPNGLPGLIPAPPKMTLIPDMLGYLWVFMYVDNGTNVGSISVFPFSGSA